MLQVSVSANKELYEDIKRRDKDMCQAMKELMKEEIAEEIENEKLIDIKKMMKNLKLSAKEAMKALEIPAADQRRYSAMLKAK